MHVDGLNLLSSAVLHNFWKLWPIWHMRAPSSYFVEEHTPVDQQSLFRTLMATCVHFAKLACAALQ